MLLFNEKQLETPNKTQSPLKLLHKGLKHFINFFMAAGLVVSVNSYAAQSIEISLEQQNAMGIQNVVVEKVASFPLTSITGELVYAVDQRHQLSAPIAGKIVALNDVYSLVEKSQTIAELQSEEWVALQADLLQTQAALQMALQEFKRAKQLQKVGASSTKIFNQAKADVTKWQAMKTQKKFSLQRLGMSSQQINQLISQQTINTQPLKIKAPVSGQFFDLQVNLNQEVVSGQALAMIGEDNELVIDVAVPVEMAMNLQPGDEVYIPLLQQPASISQIFNQVNIDTQTVDVHIRIANPEHKLKAGLRLAVHLMQSTNHELYKIPASALSQLEGSTVVYQAEGEQIQALAVELLNVSKGQAFVSLTDKSPANIKQVVSVGSAAIKAAFSNDEEAE